MKKDEFLKWLEEKPNGSEKTRGEIISELDDKYKNLMKAIGKL